MKFSIDKYISLTHHGAHKLHGLVLAPIELGIVDTSDLSCTVC
jgi:hypothetical protein